MIAAAVANELDSEFIHVDAASIMSKWLGEAEKNVAKIFKTARSSPRRRTNQLSSSLTNLTHYWPLTHQR